MFKLLKKEFFLAAHPMMLVFTLMTCMILIPNYPPVVGFVYVIVSFTFLFPLCFENKDYYYTALLPVKKQDVVTSKFLTVCTMEIIALVIAIPCALVRSTYASKMGLESNVFWFDANFALFASALIMFGLFNFIFFIMHYKSSTKILLPMLLSMITSMLFGLVMDIINGIPFVRNFLSSHLYIQLIYLFLGMILFIGLTIISYIISSKRFTKINL